MEYRTIASKLPINESTMFKVYCEKKGVTPANLIRELVLKEMKITIPHTVAGRNKIKFDKTTDTFTWLVKLDNGENVEVLKFVSPLFIQNLHEVIKLGLDERAAFIHKENAKSIPIPSNFIRKDV